MALIASSNAFSFSEIMDKINAIELGYCPEAPKAVGNF